MKHLAEIGILYVLSVADTDQPRTVFNSRIDGLLMPANAPIVFINKEMKMFDSMHNGWAEIDDAHCRNEERREAREAMRDAYLDSIIGDLVSTSQAYGTHARVINKAERQKQDEAMEGAFEWIFGNPDKQSQFEIALLQIWEMYRGKEDSPLSRLANVIDYGIAGFANYKARELSRGN